MHINQYKENFLLRNRQILNASIAILILFAIFLPAIFYFMTVKETLDYGIDLLGEERYNTRMTDSRNYALVLLLFILLIISPGVLVMKSFKKSYQSLVKSLTTDELITLKEYNDNRKTIIQRFLPAFILTNDKIHFFGIFGKVSLEYTTITNFSITRIRSRNGGFSSYMVKIFTLNRNYKFLCSIQNSQIPELERILHRKSSINKQ